MDLEKLRPAPWHAEYFDAHGCWDLTYGPEDDGSERFSVLEDDNEEKHAEAIKFAALARNWLDTQERRKWSLEYYESDGWAIFDGVERVARLPYQKTALEAWQAAVDYDRELTAKSGN